MKAKISDFKYFFGVHELTELLKYFGVPERTREKVFNWIINNTQLSDYLNKFHEWRTRDGVQRVKIKIHNYDTCNADVTLAYLIIPILMKLRDTTHSFPPDDEIRSVEDWKEVLNKIISSMEHIINNDWEDQYTIVQPEIDMDNDEEYDEKTQSRPLKWKTEGKYDWEGLKKHNAEIQEGCELLGKHFRNLWD